MPLCTRIPAAALAPFVACYWHSEGAPAALEKERLMPTGEACIIVNLRDDPLRLYAYDDLDRSDTYGFAMLSGARTQPFVIDNQQQDRIFGIQFRPAGGFPFFPIPASETADLAVPLDCVWRSRANEFRERLLAADDVSSMFEIAESFMLAQAARTLHRAVRFSLKRFCHVPHASTVADVADQLNLSQRHLIQVFREQVGLTPKTFCRVRRFQYVLQSIHLAPQPDWAQVALEFGYYDQAHFAHDFRCFSGFTPTQYWQRRTPHLNHVPIPQ
jgi:AraC-like DNA-binding protein